MRREGRQHGSIFTWSLIPSVCDDMGRSINKSWNQLDDCGPFPVAPSKPTYHSRFTSRCSKPRCRNCHSHPPTKAMAKTKGMHKRRDNEVEAFLKWELYDFDEAAEIDDGGLMEGGDVDSAEPYWIEDCGGGDEDGEWVFVDRVEVLVQVDNIQR